MTPRTDIAWSRQIAAPSGGQAGLWVLSAALMLTVHGGGAWWLMHQSRVPPALETAPAAVMIDLAPVPAAAVAAEEQLAVDEVDAVEVDAPEPVDPVETIEPVEEVQTAKAAEPVEDAEPVETIEPPEETTPVETVEAQEPETLSSVESESVAEVEPETAEPIEEPVDLVEQMVVSELERVEVPLPTVRPDPPPPSRETARQERKPDPKPVRRVAPPKQQQAAPSTAQARALTRSEPAPQASGRQSARGNAATISPARWQSLLISHLERRKRYPAGAGLQRRQGTAQVRFSVDADGNVQSVTLARSSGVPEFDAEAIAMVRRGSPVPPPPPGVRTVVIPVRFGPR